MLVAVCFDTSSAQHMATLQRMFRNFHKATVAGSQTDKFGCGVSFVGAEEAAHVFLVKIIRQ